ncbi:BTB/POZ domain and ankyrin repeat-containing protein NPR1-like isoform X2 [Andrographis paniculata]|uniref:BTB/POZ domain and ankyrin repeat-containing protein NPR1-like isoform X2 n=1 Tax=Andrographis paniculata TaxID=175694 RepID=UPI0021E98E5A|nr:BTB/POZ domain and ankyrin repeat-containing protein NPR1-like isoform X2 [Andrographis paniculata]
MDTRIAFSDSNDVAGGGSSSGSELTLSLSTDQLPPDVAALKRLSETLESIFFDGSSPPAFDFFSDARMVVESGREIPVHRCVLSARSPFFKNLFLDRESDAKVEMKEVLKEYEVGFDALSTVLAYAYSGKVRVSGKGVCECVDEDCSHLACRPAVGFMVEVLYASFVFQINELVSRFQKNLMDVLDKATADDVLMVLSVASMCGTLCQSLVCKSINIVAKSDLDIITLDKALPPPLVKQINELRLSLGIQSHESNTFPDKHIKRIHRALESDDVELVRMLLKEDNTNLDDACALHYAVAYCDAKTTTELLDLAIADINLRNLRGYTVLHVAAMRKDPKIIVSLLTKGARPSDLTADGRKALQISKRLTRAIDYYKNAEGKSTPSDRLCIEILEQAERRDPLLGEASMSLAMAGDDFRKNLLYLENRVALAQVLFPMEAKVAMDIARVDGTSEFPLNGTNKNMSVSQRTGVDLNEAPFKIKEEHLNRLKALSKTVELGKRFFPRCSAVLNKIMDREDYTEIAQQGNGSVNDCPLKRQRRQELEEVLSKAYTEDKEELDRATNLTSSSSSSAPIIKSNENYFFYHFLV